MGMRVPRIAGVAGGVGTSLLADALHAIDDGVYVDGPVDVLVCRTTLTSLGDAHRALSQVVYPPVLAVVADIPDVVPGPVRARIRMASAYLLDAIAVPFVGEWRNVDDPYSEASWVLDPDIRLPKSLRPFSKAMRSLAHALEPLLSTNPIPAEPADSDRESDVDHDADHDGVHDADSDSIRELTRPRLA